MEQGAGDQGLGVSQRQTEADCGPVCPIHYTFHAPLPPVLLLAGGREEGIGKAKG